MSERKKNTETRRIPLYCSLVSISVFICICLSAGIVYISIQWARYQEILDAEFVSLLIAATIVLTFGLRALQEFISKKGKDFYDFVLASEDPEEVLERHARLSQSVFDHRSMTFFGVIYGLTVASSPLYFGIWEDDKVAQASLMAFLFLVNFATGVGITGLVKFFHHALNMGKLIRVDLWKMENPSTSFILGSTRRIAVVVSIYVCLAQVSIIFSLFPIGGVIIGYALFAIIVIVGSIVVPIYPIMRTLKVSKEFTLAEIDDYIHKEFSSILGAIEKPDTDQSLSRFESLVALREKVSRVNVWPFKSQSIMAGLSVLFFSSLPVLIQHALQSYGS